MKKTALPRNLDLDALVEILAQNMRERSKDEAQETPQADSRR
ncbi:hypothetical protein [Jannaschia seohaensis]|uniref:Uncharacterized protein n=1 Tax=Jannaschia seohaensis TaxID=475081 RepID=A0A2Y9C3Y6_9RHOB|nr:hypothetical protein [Jannaschia seohaensis]PWJ22365.1 hypothetical protein BCF38_101776 [Jannaschia seohaensis]SSA38643.1 hypothetical protein SAMN05421539_101776 [Jannaschia seohaensis]